MTEPDDFPAELRAGAKPLIEHPYTSDLLMRAADEIERLRAGIKSEAADTLIANLRALARAEHSDLSIADDAADEIERLRARNAEHEARYDALEVMVDFHKEKFERLYAALEQAVDDFGDDCVCTSQSS